MTAPPPDAAAMALERPAGVAIPRPPRAARLKELAFKGALLSCLGVALVTLAGVSPPELDASGAASGVG